MWYFAWVLGTGLAVCFGVLNAMWFENKESEKNNKN
jgi:cytochrome bd-I ubiquinol oxidase subunit X